MKKTWKIQVSQNSWEYTGWVLVTASELTKTGEKTVLADGVLIEFDEEIGTIEATLEPLQSDRPQVPDGAL